MGSQSQATTSSSSARDLGAAGRHRVTTTGTEQSRQSSSSVPSAQKSNLAGAGGKARHDIAAAYSGASNAT